MMFAAMLAGIAFGNAGCHLPHAMSYAVSGLVEDYHAPQYPGSEPIVPHGMAVVLNAPAVFRYTAQACPERHLEAAKQLGAEVRGAGPDDAGEILATRITEFMQATGMPNGVAAVGYARERSRRTCRRRVSAEESGQQRAARNFTLPTA